jgi:hypothetical protein
LRAAELLIQQFTTVNAYLHQIADDLSDDEWTRRVLPETNILGFDIWHVARTQDWAVQTLARGVPEVITAASWQAHGALAGPGIGVGMTRAEADAQARAVQKPFVLAYADAVHQAILAWLAQTDDATLDTKPNLDIRHRRCVRKSPGWRRIHPSGAASHRPMGMCAITSRRWT